MIETERILEIYCDGSCYNRPPFNSMGIGFIAVDSGDDLKVKYNDDIRITAGYAVDLQTKGTNNIAEYAALIESLSYLLINYKPITDFQIDKVIIHSDSTIVVDQMCEISRVNSKHLQSFHKAAMLLLKMTQKYTDVTIKWVSRKHAYLKIADKAARYGNPYFRSTTSPGRYVFNLVIHNYNEEIKR